MYGVFRSSDVFGAVKLNVGHCHSREMDEKSKKGISYDNYRSKSIFLQ